MADEKKPAAPASQAATKTKPQAPATKKPAPATAKPAGDAQVKAEARPKMALRIAAKPKEGFRRCGVHHPFGPADHPEGRFTAKEIQILKGEPNLVVVDL